MKPDEFIAMLAGPAQECQKAHGIPASFTLAQAALESAWGASKLANIGLNLFGVKADKSWAGPTCMMMTAEYRNGQRVMEQAKWRAYANWEECLNDHAAFFRKNPRYAACFKQTTGEGWAKAVAAAGYATDPEYADKLIRTMRARKLARFDKVAA